MCHFAFASLLGKIKVQKKPLFILNSLNLQEYNNYEIMSKLSAKDIEKRLLSLPEWEYYDDALQAEFEFENFKDCFSAMSRIAFECEALNHHPNWTNVYNVLTISLTTHDEDGVTEKDFELAKAIESIVVPEDED